MHQPPRILLTGAAGFIGSQLARELLARGAEVFGVDDFSGGWPGRLPESSAFGFAEGDVSEPGFLPGLLRAEGPFDQLVHLAAKVGVRSVLRDPEGCRMANLRGVRELVSAVAGLDSGLRPRVFAASSSEVYEHKAGPLREGDPTRDIEASGRWAYAASKLRGEQILEEAASLWSAERQPVHLRFFNIVGPGQDAESGMVLPTFVECALRGAALPLHGDGSQVRTFALVSEAARSLADLLELPRLCGGALNLGGRARTSIGALALEVIRQANSGSVIERIDPLRSCGANFEGILYREPDLGRLKALGLEAPGSDLERIVSETLRHHLELARPLTRSPREAACVSPAS
jgi:UDP-glucose 4-epimerase